MRERPSRVSLALDPGYSVAGPLSARERRRDKCGHDE
jgi:hypothetical protein